MFGRVASFSAMFLAGAASLAVAQGGVNLAWDDCGSWGARNRDFACDTNVGSNVLYASGTLPHAARILGCVASVDIFGRDFQMPAWWQMATGGCRSLAPPAVTAEFDLAPAHCATPWPVLPNSSVQVSNRSGYVRVLVVADLPEPVALNATDEYLFFELRISNAATVGAGSCAGCATGVCLYLPEIEMFVPAGDPSASIWRGLDNLVFWQGARYGAECTTAARRPTWGAVKSLYR